MARLVERTGLDWADWFLPPGNPTTLKPAAALPPTLRTVWRDGRKREREREQERGERNGRSAPRVRPSPFALRPVFALFRSCYVAPHAPAVYRCFSTLQRVPLLLMRARENGNTRTKKERKFFSCITLTHTGDRLLLCHAVDPFHCPLVFSRDPCALLSATWNHPPCQASQYCTHRRYELRLRSMFSIRQSVRGSYLSISGARNDARGIYIDSFLLMYRVKLIC